MQVRNSERKLSLLHLLRLGVLKCSLLLCTEWQNSQLKGEQKKKKTIPIHTKGIPRTLSYLRTTLEQKKKKGATRTFLKIFMVCSKSFGCLAPAVSLPW